MQTRGAVRLTIMATLLTTGVAHAASLGDLTSRSLAEWTQAATITTPTLLTCDDFSRAAATGSALNTRPVQLPANCGAFTWTSHLGTWTISSGQLAATTTNATATIATGQTDISAETTILNANGSSRIAGVAIDHTGSTRIFLVAVLSGPGTAMLQLVNGVAITTLATAAATVTASTVLRITRNGTTVTVSVNGTLALTYTLTSAQVTTLAAGVRVGLYWNSGSTIRYTNVVATSPVSP